MRYIKFLPALLLVLSLCVGCGPSKPSDVPKLFSTQVTVVKGGSPVVGANVFLVADSGTATGSWSVAGKTDQMGLAVIKTSQGDWSAPGAPEGAYKIYLTKFVEIEEPERPADMDADEEAKKAFYEERAKRLKAAGSEIPENMKLAETSGLSITVGGKLTELTIDVDKAAE